MSTINNEPSMQGEVIKDEKVGLDDILKQTLNDSTTDSTQQAPSDQTHPGAPDDNLGLAKLSEKEKTKTTSDDQVNAEDGADHDRNSVLQESSGSSVEIETPASAGDGGATDDSKARLSTTVAASVDNVGLSVVTVGVNETQPSHALENPSNLHKAQEDFDKKYPVDVYLHPASDQPIETPTANDILFGRGGLTNHHPGNKKYRQIIAEHKSDYVKAAKIIKPRVARRIVHSLRNATPPARFLKKNPEDNLWRDVGDKAASEKTSQALREKSPEEKKASSAKKHKPTNSVASGYTMPVLPGNGPSVTSSSTDGIEKGTRREVDRSLRDGFDESANGHTAVYPVEGGIFGTVNAEGDIVVMEQDILLGRGGATNHHKGNKRFRDIVALHRPDYLAAPKIRKPDVSRKIVQGIRNANPPGRFLKKGEDGKWFDVGDKKAAEKASQALREKGPEARKARANANTIANHPYRLSVDASTDIANSRPQPIEQNFQSPTGGGQNTDAINQEAKGQKTVGEVAAEEESKRKSATDDDDRELKRKRPLEFADV